MKKLFLTLFALIALGATAASIWTATIVVGNTSRVAARVVYGKPCKLFSVMGYNDTNVVQWLYIFEAKSYPTNGTQARLGPFPIGATNYYSVDLSAYGADLDSVTVGISSSGTSFTAAQTNATIQAIIVPNQ